MSWTYIRQTIEIVDGLDISDEDRGNIYRKNALKLLKLNGSLRVRPRMGSYFCPGP